MSYDPKADKKYNAKSNYTGVFHIKLFECGCSIKYYMIQFKLSTYRVTIMSRCSKVINILMWITRNNVDKMWIKCG